MSAGVMEQIRDTLEGFQQMTVVPVQHQNSYGEEAGLAESFLLSVKNAANPGLGLDS